jgi:urea transporter
MGESKRASALFLSPLFHAFKEKPMQSIVNILFGPSWKSTLIGYAAMLVTAALTFAQQQPQPGWYVVALALGALGRVVKDTDKTNAAQPVAAQKAP